MVSIWWRFNRGSRATSLCTESEWAGEVKDRFTQHLSSSYSSYIRGPGRRRSRPASPCCPLRLVSWSYLVKSWSLRAGFTRIYLTPFGFTRSSYICSPRPHGGEAIYIHLWSRRRCIRIFRICGICMDDDEVGDDLRLLMGQVQLLDDLQSFFPKILVMEFQDDKGGI
jgi:hypothetical protein